MHGRNYGETYTKGIPAHWVSPFDEAYYNGRAYDVHGEPIIFRNRDGKVARDGDFAGRAPDPRDPPRVEGQAAYLARFKLLLPGERARLTKSDFEPKDMDVEA